MRYKQFWLISSIFFSFLIFFVVLYNKDFTLFASIPSIQAQTLDTDWPQVQHDQQRTGKSGVDIVEPLHVKWRWLNGNRWDESMGIPLRFDVEIPVLAQPIIGDGKVYVGSYEGSLYAIDQETGMTQWVYTPPLALPFLHTAAYADQKVFIGSSDGYLYAVDSQTGNLVWKYRTGSIYSAPLLVNDQVCIGSKTNFFYCFSINDSNNDQEGDLLFRYDAQAPIYHTAAASPDGSRIYFGSDDMRTQCVLSSTGTQCPGWIGQQVSGETFMHYWPVVSSSRVVFTSMPALPTSELQGLSSSVEKLMNDQIGSDWSTVIEPVLSQHFIEQPYKQTLTIIDAMTGLEAVDTAMAHMSYHQDTLVPPVLASDVEAWLFFPAKETSLSRSYDSLYGPSFGGLNVITGKITPFGGQVVPTDGRVGEYGSIPVNDLDDNVNFTMGSQVVYTMHNRRCVAGLDTKEVKSFNAGQSVQNLQLGNCGGSNVPFFFSLFDEPPKGGYPKIAGSGNRGEGLMGPSMSYDTLFMVFRGGAVMAVEGTKRL
jgi:hypothetical protein